MKSVDPKGLGFSVLAGAIVVADPDNYGADGFPWWVNLLFFVTISVATYFLWYGFFGDSKDSENTESTVKKSTQLIVGAAAMAILLVLVLFLSLR